MLGYNQFAYCENNPILYADKEGRAVDVILDIISLCLGLKDFIEDPNLKNGVCLGADAVLTLVPVISAFGSLRHLDNLDDSYDLMRMYGHIDNFANAGGTIRRTKRSDFAFNMASEFSKLRYTDEGFTISNIASGRKIHKSFMSGGEAINKFNRVDGIDHTKHIIYELKPYNEASIKQGIKQLYRYRDAALKKYNAVYEMVLVLY